MKKSTSLVIALVACVYFLSGCSHHNKKDFLDQIETMKSVKCAFSDDWMCRIWGYPSHQEIRDSFRDQCLTLEKVESNDRPEYADFLYFEGNVMASGPSDAEERAQVGKSYLVSISHYYGPNKAQMSHVYDHTTRSWNHLVPCKK